MIFMKKDYYYIAIDRNGNILNDFHMKCDEVICDKLGMTFVHTCDNGNKQILAFYTYDIVAGYEKLAIE